MPDETTIQEPQEGGAEGADMTSPNFDWDAFWGGPSAGDEPLPPAPLAAEGDDYEEVGDDLAAERDRELAALRKQSELNAKQLAEMRNQSIMDRAIDEWKKQASPAEIALSELLYESQSVEELKRNEQRVKAAAKKAEELYGAELARKQAEMERELQAKFGIPLPPTFQPIPQAEKANQALAEGDLDRAAAIMLEGMF
jgi:hypothetical protein